MFSLSNEVINDPKKCLSIIERFHNKLAQLNEKDIGSGKSRHTDAIENFKTKYNKLIASISKLENQYLECNKEWVKYSWSPNGLHDLNIEIKNFNDDLNQIEKNLIYLLEGMEFLDKDENIADLCWNNGHSIAKSNELVRLAIDIKNSEELLKRSTNDKKIKDLIDRKKREYDNTINLDRQLIAESKLKEQNINLYGGKKTLEVSKLIEDASRFYNADQLLQNAKEKYFPLNKILTDLNLEKIKVEELNRKINHLNEQIKSANSMHSSVSQKVKVRKSYHKKSKKTKNKREEIIQEDDVEKDKEREAILKFERKQFNERKKLSNTPLTHGQVITYSDSTIKEISEQYLPIIYESNLIVNCLQERPNLNRVSSKNESLMQNAINIMKYSEQFFQQHDHCNRNSQYYIKIKVKHLQKRQRQELDKMTNDQLLAKLESNDQLLSQFKQKLDKWREEKEKIQIESMSSGYKKQLNKKQDKIQRKIQRKIILFKKLKEIFELYIELLNNPELPAQFSSDEFSKLKSIAEGIGTDDKYNDEKNLKIAETIIAKNLPKLKKLAEENKLQPLTQFNNLSINDKKIEAKMENFHQI